MAIEIAKLNTRKFDDWTGRHKPQASDWNAVLPGQLPSTVSVADARQLAASMLVEAALDIGFKPQELTISKRTATRRGLGAGVGGRRRLTVSKATVRPERVAKHKFEGLVTVSRWLASDSDAVLSFSWCCQVLGMNDRRLRRAFGQQLNVALPLDC